MVNNARKPETHYRQSESGKPDGKRTFVALGARLQKSPHITTLGLKPNFSDYSETQRNLICNAEKIYFPTTFYADLFNAIGKKTFPSYHTYKFAQDKIKQTAVFKLLNIPHPETRTFFGKRQKNRITDCFSFPFVAKKARGSARGAHVYMINNTEDLARYLTCYTPAYIQEYLPLEKDIRVIVVGKEVRLAYWRKSRRTNFRTNISQGGRILFDPVPQKALELALETALKCGWDDVGIDIIEKDGRFYVIEANMKYGTTGFKKAGIDYKKMLEGLILSGKV